MLQDGPGLVLLDALGHHVQDVVHDGGTQLQVKVGLHTLLGHRLGHTLGVTSCEERTGGNDAACNNDIVQKKSTTILTLK